MFDTLIKHSPNREKLDFYATHPSVVEDLLEREKFRNKVLEPACGMGHISKVLEWHGYKVLSSDIEDRGYGDVKDFFEVTNNELDIVTNPPYFCALDFIKHAINVSEKGIKIAMLFRLGFLESKSRYEFFKANPPIKVYVISKRIRCAKNGEFEKYKSSAIAFAWFIREVGYKGEPILKWIE